MNSIISKKINFNESIDHTVGCINQVEGLGELQDLSLKVTPNEAIVSINPSTIGACC